MQSVEMYIKFNVLMFYLGGLSAYFKGIRL